MKKYIIGWRWKICAILFPIFIATSSMAIEVGIGGHYIKSYYSVFRNSSFFDSEQNLCQFDYKGKSRFITFVVDYHYGLSNRANIGFILPWVSNRFENEFDVYKRERISDITLLFEYRFLNLPNILSLRLGIISPTDYETNHPIWLGNGTTEALLGLVYKHFLRKRKFDPFWYEIDFALRLPMNENKGNIDGNWSVPIRLGFSYRPIFVFTLGSGIIASLNECRHFVGVEGIIKYRLNFPIELELGITHIVNGRNSSAGTAILLGILINTARIWD